jgi:hypothetical protein
VKFRKKPVVIEAWPVSDLILAAKMGSWDALPQSLRDSNDSGGLVVCEKRALIQTLEGEMEAGFDDWIIKGVAGELYPCKPDIFEATYEAVGG